ncbi:hypothetical protein OAG37_02840, partial [Akkermansiaceae bacterium]|nr:hypothetical protein [Akkermansiaceae bacterium]
VQPIPLSSIPESGKGRGESLKALLKVVIDFRDPIAIRLLIISAYLQMMKRIACPRVEAVPEVLLSGLVPNYSKESCSRALTSRSIPNRQQAPNSLVIHRRLGQVRSLSL